MDMAKVAKGRRASAEEVANWVMDNLVLPLDSIDFDGIPSPAAVAILRQVREDEKIREKYMTQVFTTMLRSSLGSEGDGASRDGKMQELIARARESEADRREQEEREALFAADRERDALRQSTILVDGGVK